MMQKAEGAISLYPAPTIKEQGRPPQDVDFTRGVAPGSPTAVK